MPISQAVGIDLGTTYSCIAHLNPHGEPVTLANEEGELCTPSAVLFDGDEVIVGTEALRNAIVNPENIVQNSKRHIGEADYRWIIQGRPYTPIDIAACILKKMLASAQQQIGVIEEAVITVPAQFSDAQRHATIEAGHRAGLARVDVINEPVAAALCYVLGTEGLWFTELADEQRILVYDLGGGTFDLSLVKYHKNEVRVIASSGDLKLGGIDWNHVLLKQVCTQFAARFGTDPRDDSKSLQALSLDVEQAKRSLSVRGQTSLTIQHAGHRKTYKCELDQFEQLTEPLVERTAQITKRLLKEKKLGWAHVDVVLTTGGASRMPMIRNKLKEMSGRTRNTSLSPDLSIAHGATYYAGMLLTSNKFAKSILNPQATARLSQIKQLSVNARALGILVRDMHTNERVPHYLISANTSLPASVTATFGTVVAGQKRVNLQIVESGATPESQTAVLGSCVIDELPPHLPAGAHVAVTIRYDEQARVHVDAREVSSGKQASTQIIRRENLVGQLESIDDPRDVDAEVARLPGFESKTKEMASKRPQPVSNSPRAHKPRVEPRPSAASMSRRKSPQGTKTPAHAPRKVSRKRGPLESAEQPIPLCNDCGEPLDARGRCTACAALAARKAPKRAQAAAGTQSRKSAASPVNRKTDSKKNDSKKKKIRQRPKANPPAAPEPLGTSTPEGSDFDSIVDADFIELKAAESDEMPVRRSGPPPRKKSAKGKRNKRQAAAKSRKANSNEDGEDEFWKLAD